MLAVAGGMAFPGAQYAAAQGAFGGYTYTQRVCQEYGQQPRYYGVRDGQAAYNGGNSDRGWLIVLERGSGGISGRYEPVTDGSPGTHVGDGTDFVLINLQTTYYLESPWRTSNIGIFVKVRDTGADSDYVLALNGLEAVNRWNYIPAIGGGRCIRWANIAWCR